jgi:DHA1 family inner membrane transport protein
MENHASPRKGLFVLAAAYFTLGTGSLAVIGLLDPMARHFHVSQAGIAQLVTVFALTFAVSAPALQMLPGRLPRRILLIAGLLVMAAGSLGSALAPSFGWAVAARVVMAVGAAAVGPVASALGASMVQQQEQTKALAIVFGGMTVATVLGVPLSSWIGQAMSWQAVFVLLALAALACAAAAATMIRDGSAGQRVTAHALIQVFERASTAWGVTVTLFQMAAQFASYALISLLLKEQFGASAATVSIALLVFGVGGIAGNAIAGRIGDRFATDRVIWVSIAGLFAVFVMLAFAPALPVAALTLLSAWAVVAMLFQAPQQKRLISLAPQLRGLLLAVNASALYLGMSVGSFAASRVYGAWGTHGLPPASATLVVLSAIALVLSQLAEKRDGRQQAVQLAAQHQ